MPTLFEKIYDAHVVAQPEYGPPLLYIDRHLVHEVTSPQAFTSLRHAGRPVRRPDLTFAVADHVVPTEPGCGRPLDDATSEEQLAALEQNCAYFGLTCRTMGHPEQGVIHVTMPEMGVVLPGNTVMCGDSHTATHGAMGALAIGVGTSEVEHILATQTLPQPRLKTLSVLTKGLLQAGVYGKDLILAIIGALGNGGGTGYSIEFMGPAVEALTMDGRMTLCNMSVECGAKSSMVAPDQITFDFLKGSKYAPAGADFERAMAFWQTLKSDSIDEFDRVLELDAAALEPQVTWGTSPAQETSVTGKVPHPDSFTDPVQKKAAQKALDYIKLEPGTPMSEVKLDVVFIGSCTNGRLEDLRIAAGILKGKKVASNLEVLVVPGSHKVKDAAEAEGLDRIFSEAGASWREPGCSMCLAMNPDVLGEGQRCASTSNRNFEGRQGRGGLTHLVSPATAAASALTGRISDARGL